LVQNAEEGLRDLQQILQVENVNNAIRIGDVYALLIEYHANRQRWKQAYTILQEMKEYVPETSLRFYVNPNLLAMIHRELNIDYNPMMQQQQQQQKVPTQTNQQQQRQSENYDDTNENDDEIRDTVDYGTYDD
jgi:hypothetical protein